MTADEQDISVLFNREDLPEFVFRDGAVSCAWFSMDELCCSYGWTPLSALARQHGDTFVHMLGLDLQEAEVVTLEVDANDDAYGALCDDELLGANIIRWWSPSARWGIHGSRNVEIAVAGQVTDSPWPRSTECDLRSIDSAMRLARVSDDARQKMLASYDALSWDPALETESAVRQLGDACRSVLADQVDVVAAIRRFVDLLDVAPKQIRRIPATTELHKAWGRTSYLLLGADRASFGPLLLAENDSNHTRHSADERSIVLRAAEAILGAIERSGAS
jgi:hypothetical protein